MIPFGNLLPATRRKCKMILPPEAHQKALIPGARNQFNKTVAAGIELTFLLPERHRVGPRRYTRRKIIFLGCFSCLLSRKTRKGTGLVPCRTENVKTRSDVRPPVRRKVFDISHVYRVKSHCSRKLKIKLQSKSKSRSSDGKGLGLDPGTIFSHAVCWNRTHVRRTGPVPG